MKYLLLTLLVFSNFLIMAQSKCGTGDVIFNKKDQNEVTEMKRIRSYIKNSNRSIEDSTLIFPVVVHIIYDGNKTKSGNISDAQVEDGIRILNEDFNKKNADTTLTKELFKPYAANCNMEFRLAQIDPEGNQTNGIVRVDSNIIPRSSHDSINNNTKEIKAVSAWDPSKYFNIWVYRNITSDDLFSQILGYAQYPGTDFTYGGPWSTWGVVIKYTAFGSIEEAKYDGRTLSHEVGHCFGLYHPFKTASKNDCYSACDTTGDEICDTPPTYVSYSCDTSNYCSNDTAGPSIFSEDVIDQTENFMSYNECQSMFTIGQKERMRGFAYAFENIIGLTRKENLINTGVLPGLSINENQLADDVIVYPNPTNNKIGIKTTDTGNMRLYNIRGQEIFQSSFNGNTEFKIGNQSPGLYFMKITFGNRNVITYKITIQ